MAKGDEKDAYSSSTLHGDVKFNASTYPDEKHPHQEHQDLHVDKALEAAILDEDDVHAHIQSIVPTTDDPTIAVTTFRVLLLSTIWSIASAFVNNLMAFRVIPLTISSSVVTLLAFPVGHFLARVLPTRKYRTFGYDWSFNPGPFTMKEHILIVLTSSAAGGGAGIPYGMDNVVAQKLFMGDDAINFWNALGWILCTQLIGFGIAGVLRRFLVWPAAMSWPSTFSTMALFISFHPQDGTSFLSATSRWKMSRYKFFWIALGITFLYQWIPQYFMITLQAVSLLCFVTDNKSARLMFSSYPNHGGPGILGLTFDWNYLGSTWMSTPFWAACCILIGNIVFLWIIPAAMFFGNAYGMDQSLYLRSPEIDSRDNYTFPAYNTARLFDNTGKEIKPHEIVTPITYDLDEDVYAQKGPIQITAHFAVGYGQSFLNIACLLSHTFLWFGSMIMSETKAMLKGRGREGGDVHNELMRAYPEVPEWVYLSILVASTTLMCIVGVYTPFVMPIWAVFLALAIGIIFVLPIGIIVALTGNQVGLNVITEFVAGLLMPGKTVAVMGFKSLGYNMQIQAIMLLNDLKLGHYLHIPPWHMLMTQLYGTIIGCIVGTATAITVTETMKDKLLSGEDPVWSAADFQVFTNAGVVWGAIAPARFFGGVYTSLYWFFLVGFALPFLPWLANKAYPSKLWPLINFPLLTLPYYSTGQPQSWIIMTFLVSFLSQWYAFRKHHDWYSSYNYVLGAALDGGNTINTLLVLVVQAFVIAPVWAGNPDGRPFDYYCYDPTNWGQNAVE